MFAAKPFALWQLYVTDVEHYGDALDERAAEDRYGAMVKPLYLSKAGRERRESVSNRLRHHASSHDEPGGITALGINSPAPNAVTSCGSMFDKTAELRAFAREERSLINLLVLRLLTRHGRSRRSKISENQKIGLDPSGKSVIDSIDEQGRCIT
jgi:hypothetical protein